MNEEYDEDTFVNFIDDRIAERLSQGLVFNLHIPDGIHLVSAIGNGDEENNSEAIKNWVKNQNLENNNIDFQQILMTLEDKLSNVLCDLKTRHILY